jgi:flagellar hook-associated protein 1 FlgK
LIGDQQYTVSASLQGPGSTATYPNAPPTVHLSVSNGADITNGTTEGQLGALLNVSNQVLPSYLGDSNQAGGLNILAKQFADRVNQLLTSGNISDGPPPVPGVPIFQYDTTNDTNVANTLTINPTITPDQLAAISPGPPYVSNGVALAISQLATPSNAADEINGVSYTEYYGNMASAIGSQLRNAQGGLQVQQSLLAQAQNQRQQLSGVDINAEAMVVVEFQRAYEANSKLITVLDQLTQDTINMLQSA